MTHVLAWFTSSTRFPGLLVGFVLLGLVHRDRLSLVRAVIRVLRINRVVHVQLWLLVSCGIGVVREGIGVAVQCRSGRRIRWRSIVLRRLVCPKSIRRRSRMVRDETHSISNPWASSILHHHPRPQSRHTAALTDSVTAHSQSCTPKTHPA